LVQEVGVIWFQQLLDSMGYSRQDVKVILGRLSTNAGRDPFSSKGALRIGNKRSTLTVIGLFLGYTCFCAMRRSFPQQMPIIGRELNIPHSQLGMPNSVFAVTYAISKFGGAIASDYLPCSECHALGLVLCGLACVMLGLCSDLNSFVLFWGLQGLLQGFGWPTVVRIVVSELPAHARSKYWGILSTAGNAGQMLGSYGMTMAATAGATWRAVFFGSGTLVMAAAFPVWLLLRSGRARSDFAKDGKDEKTTATQQSHASRSKLAVLQNPALVALMVCNGLAYFVRNSMAEWGLIYTQSTHLAGSQMQATTLLFWVEVGGSFGAFFSGYLSSFLGSRHGLTTLLAAFLLATATGATVWSAYRSLDTSGNAGLQAMAQSPMPFSAICVLHAMAGVGLQGVRSMLGLHAATIAAASGAAGMASGLLEVVGQVGCVMAGQLGAFATSRNAMLRMGVATDPAAGWVSALAVIALASTVIASLHVPLVLFEERRLAMVTLAGKKKVE